MMIGCHDTDIFSGFTTGIQKVHCSGPTFITNL